MWSLSGKQVSSGGTNVPGNSKLHPSLCVHTKPCMGMLSEVQFLHSLLVTVTKAEAGLPTADVLCLLLTLCWALFLFPFQLLWQDTQQKQLRGIEGSLRLIVSDDLTAERSQQQKFEGVDHITSVIGNREQRDAHTLVLSLPSPLYTVQDPLPREWFHLQLRSVFLDQLT